MSRFKNQDVVIRKNQETGLLEIHLYFKQGTSFNLPLEFFDDKTETTEQDWTGYTHTMAFNDTPDGTTLIQTWTEGAGLTVASTKTVTLNITPARTSSLPELSYADLKGESGTGEVHPNHHTRFMFHKIPEVSS